MKQTSLFSFLWESDLCTLRARISTAVFAVYCMFLFLIQPHRATFVLFFSVTCQVSWVCMLLFSGGLPHVHAVTDTPGSPCRTSTTSCTRGHWAALLEWLQFLCLAQGSFSSGCCCCCGRAGTYSFFLSSMVTSLEENIEHLIHLLDVVRCDKAYLQCFVSVWAANVKNTQKT